MRSLRTSCLCCSLPSQVVSHLNGCAVPALCTPPRSWDFLSWLTTADKLQFYEKAAGVCLFFRLFSLSIDYASGTPIWKKWTTRKKKKVRAHKMDNVQGQASGDHREPVASLDHRASRRCKASTCVGVLFIDTLFSIRGRPSAAFKH